MNDMPEELKETIQNFLIEFKNNIEDPDMDLWKCCWDAIDLLQQVVENK